MDWFRSVIIREFPIGATEEATLPKDAVQGEMPRGHVRKVLALIPVNLDGYRFSPHDLSGKKAEITSRVAASFVGRGEDHALLDREQEKVICALWTEL